MDVKSGLASVGFALLAIVLMPDFVPRDSSGTVKMFSSNDELYEANSGGAKTLQAKIFAYARTEGSKARFAIASAASNCADGYADQAPDAATSRFMAAVYAGILSEVTAAKDGSFTPKQLQDKVLRKVFLESKARKRNDDYEHGNAFYALAGVSRNYRDFDDCVYRKFGNYIPDAEGKIAQQ